MKAICTSPPLSVYKYNPREIYLIYIDIFVYTHPLFCFVFVFLGLNSHLLPSISVKFW